MGELIPATDSCWLLDLECIVGTGNYVDVLKNMERITRGKLSFENVRDYVDIEEGVAWLEFDHEGQAYRLDLLAENDWIDPQFFTLLSEITADRKDNYRFTQFNGDGGQEMIFGFESPESLNKIVAATGLEFEWL